VESRQCEPGRCGAAGRKHRGVTCLSRLDGKQLAPHQRIAEAATSRELVIEIAGVTVAGDEDVCFAAEAPAERTRLLTGGGRTGPRQ